MRSVDEVKPRTMQMVWKTINEWNQKRKLRQMLRDPRGARGFRSTGQLETGIGADRATTERLLLSLVRGSQGTQRSGL
jgi:hypothetical protein